MLLAKMSTSLLATRRAVPRPSRRQSAAFVTIASNTLRTHPLGSTYFGAEVEGVDYSRPISPSIATEIVELQNKHGVLCFRKTGLDDAGHVQYSKNFGALETIHGMNKPRRATSAHLYDAGNLDPEGDIIPKGSRAWWHSKGNNLWHTDSSFNQQRSSYSALRAVELPPAGGETLYADMRAAYADLPSDVKQEIDGLVVEHWIWHSECDSSDR